MSRSMIEGTAFTRPIRMRAILFALVVMSASLSLGQQAYAQTVPKEMITPKGVYAWHERFGNVPPSGIAELYDGYPTGEAACAKRGAVFMPQLPNWEPNVCVWGVVSWRAPDWAGALSYGLRCPDAPPHKYVYVTACAKTLGCPEVPAGETPYTPDAGKQTCTRPDQESYTLTLTGDTQTEPSQPLSFVATVIDKATQQPPTKEVTVKISLTVDDKSGGHDHGDSTRPRGSLNGEACVTDDTCITLATAAGSGTAPFIFTPRDASGIHTITATCDKCSSEGAGNTKTVTVKVDGLLEIPASTFYVLGSSSRHGTKNHYLLPAAAEKLLLIAINYQSQVRFKVIDPNTNTLVWPEPFRVNDASLEWGGRFDIYGDWTKPHKEHMRGVSVDLRANDRTLNTIPPENFYEFGELLKNVIPGGKVARYILECTGDEEDGPQHDRVSENNCVSVLDGSFDDNRHYHIRLMGVK